MTVNDMAKLFSELVDGGKGDYIFIEEVFFEEQGECECICPREYDFVVNDKEKTVCL